MSHGKVILTGDLAGSGHASVLALTIVDARTTSDFEGIDRSSLILVGVRDPATNDSHPNVLSVPTKRVPDAVLNS